MDDTGKQLGPGHVFVAKDHTTHWTIGIGKVYVEFNPNKGDDKLPTNDGDKDYAEFQFKHA